MKPKAKRTYRTTLARALLGVGVGTLVGTGVIAALAGAMVLTGAVDRGPGLGARFAALLLLAALAWLLAMGLVSPLWWWLDRRGHRRWVSGVLVGGAGMGLLGAAWSAQTLRAMPLSGGFVGGLGYYLGAAVLTLLCAALGAVLGWIVWRIAYRKAPSVAEVF
ncbi:MAG: hypothetical protein JSR45_17850 [Proteobacteria bacterium]|nr:hypothetical protein [Pseudomonadota bacterium]